MTGTSARRRRRSGGRAPAASICCLVLLGCGGGGTAPSGPVARSTAPTATPVRTATVTRATLAVEIEAPGETRALETQKVRAPFNAILLDLRVTDGDHVAGNQPIGVVESVESHAALVGAEAMVKSARTAAQRREAERAVALARRGLVTFTLRAPEEGVVLSHSADEGDYIAPDQDIAVLAASDSIVFLADVVQTEIPSVRPGQLALVDMSARRIELPGVVHAVLPAASRKDLTAPVRIDFRPPRPGLGVGLFGTARVTVGTRPDVVAVPDAALLRDDVTGRTRVATVGRDRHVRWLPVLTGVSQGGLTEIRSGALAAGERVIVSGQVGLPEGAPVEIVR